MFAQRFEGVDGMAFFANIVASRTQKRGTGVGENVAARPSTEGGRPVKLTHLNPDAFNVAWRKWDVVGKAVGKGESLEVWHDHERVGAEHCGAFGAEAGLGLRITIPVEGTGSGKMTSASDKGERWKMWEGKEVVIDFRDVTLACGDVWMCLRRV